MEHLKTLSREELVNIAISLWFMDVHEANTFLIIESIHLYKLWGNRHYKHIVMTRNTDLLMRYGYENFDFL
jgi:hypothetical protein